MTMAGNLQEAAYITYQQLAILWTAGTLETTVALYSADLAPLFEDQVPNDRPVGNWLVLIDALLSQMPRPLPPTLKTPEDQFNQLVEYIGRMCDGAFWARFNNLITATQATAMLTAWNTRFGT